MKFLKYINLAWIAISGGLGFIGLFCLYGSLLFLSLAGDPIVAVDNVDVFAKGCSPDGSKAHSAGELEEGIPFVAGLSDIMRDPGYRVVFFVRHGKASEEGKGVDKGIIGGADMMRPLAPKGIRAAGKLASTMSRLPFGNTLMISSKAVRVETTGRTVFDQANAKSKKFVSYQDLYYADVEIAYLNKLLDPQYADVNHAVFFGHGKSMMAVFKKVADIGGEVFNPTAGVMAIAIKTESWGSFIREQHSEVKYVAWSPKDTHRINLESIGGLESRPAPIEIDPIFLEKIISEFSW